MISTGEIPLAQCSPEVGLPWIRKRLKSVISRYKFWKVVDAPPTLAFPNKEPDFCEWVCLLGFNLQRALFSFGYGGRLCVLRLDFLSLLTESAHAGSLSAEQTQRAAFAWRPPIGRGSSSIVAKICARLVNIPSL